MALSPIVDQAVADLKIAILTETAQVTAKIEELMARVNAGVDSQEVVAALSDLKAQVEGILPDALPDTQPL